jgi:hypothetical protein
MIHQQQMQVKVHKQYFECCRLNYSALFFVLLLIPIFWLGWNASKEKWISKMAAHLVELVTLTGVTYFRKQLINYLNK